MLRSCSRCGRIHDSRKICKAKRQKPRDSAADNFRSTAAWTKKSIAVKVRDLGLCRLCLQEGTLQWEDLEVHHIVPLVEDFELRLEDDNLITLCQPHHKAAERGQVSRTALSAMARVPPGGRLRRPGLCKTTWQPL